MYDPDMIETDWDAIRRLAEPRKRRPRTVNLDERPAPASTVRRTTANVRDARTATIKK